MIRIYQKTPTSCFAACIASVIECEFEDVPNYFHAPTWDHWKQRHWLEKRGYGMAEHKMLPDSMWPPTKGMICILAGKSPRGEYDHAVVAETDYDTAEPFRIIHDPWMADSNLPYAIEGNVKIVTWIIPLKR